MKIAYSCAGEGFGHASRLVTLGPQLEEDFDVVYFCPRPISAYMREKLPGARLEDLPCFEFKKKDDRILYGKTLLASLDKLLLFPWEIRRLAKRLKALEIDAVLSDFDPYLVWAARLAGIPALQLNHPGILTKFPRFDAEWLMNYFTSLFLEGPWTQRLHCSFYEGDIGPLLRPRLKSLKTDRTGTWVVNIKPGYRPRVCAVLDKAGIDYEVFPRAGADFDKAFASALGVISSAGHQIISEALALGKPILVLPQRSQHEQKLNARMLTRTGRGRSSSLNKLEKDLPAFLEWASQGDLPQGTYVDESPRALFLIRNFLKSHCRASYRPLKSGKKEAA